MVSPGLILAIALALVHGFAARLPIFSIIPRFRWTSFAGGVSLSYVFLEIFPELSHTQEELQHSEILLVQYLENHVYILALMGLLVFYGLNLLTHRAKSLRQENSEITHDESTSFWIHIIAFGILNVISGYLLQDLSEHTLIDCLLFFMAVALHFFIIDENLREHHQSLYDKKGRWFLVGAIVLGAVIGQAVHLNEAAIAIIWSFLTGSIILNVLKRELPDEKDTCFKSFLAGVVLFSILLLLM
ncbi:hypothetical protein Xen7305DRAFT_00015650 [Xenococcus sp. PCC 7305]|uniref:hypothetical protein n=1 Tax=Xenococcus sp. PCC 7305 TaxID=102125 RepID=UPI0002ACC31F|nr:hypothetical protein [Xenococcus sp. PCC 7305]ELS01858.1 hypothetical protein Xen7305DRAFT_00015650 [Xenococcus sp. PCC 7305]